MRDIPKKVWIASGGTGGHLFPSLALAAELRHRRPDVDLKFIGGHLTASRYFAHGQYAYEEVACGSFVNKKPSALVQSSLNIMRGVAQSHALMRRHKPDLIVGFGSFYALPPMLASKLAFVPLIMHAADAIPGKVIRLLSPLAVVTGVHFEETARHIRGNSALVEMPLRPGLRLGSVSREEARRYYALDVHRPTLLVFGGSQGARAINELLLTTLQKQDLRSLGLQVLHFTGDAAIAQKLGATYREKGIPAVVKPFEENMQMAWSAADFAMVRSGASSLAELREFEVPALLVPYPFGADNHQEKNADVVAREGGARKILQSQLTPDRLYQEIQALLSDEQKPLRNMRLALRDSKANLPSRTLGDLVCEFLNQE